MNGLLVAPDIGMPKADEAAWELQRVGLNIFPLTGHVTEATLAEHFRPEREYDFVVFLTHGTPLGVYLAGNPASDEASTVLLPLESVTAYVQAAATVRLVVLAVCHGQNVAKEIFFRTGATVVYSDGSLDASAAFTLLATFFRRLKAEGLSAAMQVADTLNLHFHPRFVKPNQDLASMIQGMSALLAGRMSVLERGMEAKQQVTQEQIAELAERVERVERTVTPLATAVDLHNKAIKAARATSIVRLGAFVAGLATFVLGALLIHDEALGLVRWGAPLVALVTLVLAAASVALLAYAAKPPDEEY